MDGVVAVVLFVPVVATTSVFGVEGVARGAIDIVSVAIGVSGDGRVGSDSVCF